MTVREYIRNSWEKSLRKKGHRADGIPLPYPYNSPCAEGIFDEFYYWDTCFINKGLIADGKIEDALHNALDMAFLLQKYGYMPNAAVTGMLNRTQPPVFGIMVCDLLPYIDGENAAILLSAMEREYEYWMSERVLPCGLNHYGNSANAQTKIFMADEAEVRLKRKLENADRESIGNNILAECHFLRAYTYFQLLRSWGEVPIIQEPTLSDDVELKPRSSKEDVMSFILKDLEDAIGLFSQEGYIDKNKASKPATYALKADALMWKAKVLSGGKQDLETAIKMIDNVEASGVHLLSDYKSVFANDNKKNDEIIFSFYMERYETGNLSIASNTTSRTDNLSMAANLSDAATSPNQSRHVYAPSDKVRAMYQKNEGDVRLNVAMIDLVDKEGNLILTQTNKFRGKEYTDDRYFDDDLIAYRWADLLLLRAEAYAALDKIPKAIIDLDEVRNRAGLQGYDGPTDKASVEKEICDERLRELFLEQKRWYDLVRFHFGGTINIYNEVPNLNGKENYPLYLPINYNDMVLNEHLVQTDGYDSSFKR